MDTIKKQIQELDAAKVPEWNNPGTDHSKMYHYGDVVRYQGKLVRSTHKGLNHWTPGVLNYDGRIWEVIEEEAETQPESTEEPEATQPEATKPEEAGETSPEPAAPEVPEWQPNINVKPGERYTFQGDTYEVIQGHTTQAGWEPPAVPALWKQL